MLIYVNRNDTAHINAPQTTHNEIMYSARDSSYEREQIKDLFSLISSRAIWQLGDPTGPDNMSVSNYNPRHTDGNKPSQ